MRTVDSGFHSVLAGLLVASLVPVSTAISAADAPPEAQAWIDVATFSGMGMPMGAAAGRPGLGALFGGGAVGNSFGNTSGMSAGRWVDVTLRARSNPALDEAQQAVPAGFLGAALELRAPRDAQPARDDDEVRVEEPERPRGRVLLYWGCGPAVRPGQPRILDMATAAPADLAKFFVGRSATRRGAHSAAGRPVWPNPADTRMVPEQASLVGEHAFAGKGVPAGFRFQVPAAQDLMPALRIEQEVRDGATDLRWNAIPAARAFFVAAMGGKGREDMVIWTSSELADTGFGLVDYQPNAAIDRWLKEKVLMPPVTTNCTVPKAVFGEEGAMLRLIAYGDELNLAHPPRPKDPKAKWEPVWAVKLRVKSVGHAFLGVNDAERPRARPQGVETQGRARENESPDGQPLQKPLELLRGIFGR